MAQRKKTKLYAIYYNDSSYMTYELNVDDIAFLTAAIKERVAATTSIGILHTADIRSIIEQKPKPIPKDEKPADPDLTPREREYLEYMRSAWKDEESTDWEGIQ